jgi:hypothetical protein
MGQKRKRGPGTLEHELLSYTAPAGAKENIVDNNKEIWEQFCKPPKDALSQIKGGRLNGMSSIDPMWRIMAMTQVFGPCGIGWTYEIIKEWKEESGNEASVYVEVAVKFSWEGKWSGPIPGIGGAMLLAQQLKGPYHSDEAYKMALTDALSVAFKSLGMAADIYMGKFDGEKYNHREDKLQEPEPMTPFQVDELRRWAQAFGEAGEGQSVEFINANLMTWNKETAQVWLNTFNEKSGGYKSW